jgi:hypothetical protein
MSMAIIAYALTFLARARDLVKGGAIEGEKLVLDASFIKAYSKMDPDNNRRVGNNHGRKDLYFPFKYSQYK